MRRIFEFVVRKWYDDTNNGSAANLGSTKTLMW